MKGKFNSLRDSALHYLCSNGWSTGEFGDTEAYGGYFWKTTNVWEEVQPENGEFNSVMEDWFAANPEWQDIPSFRADLVGHFVVMEVSSGQVTVVPFDSQEAMERDFNRLGDLFTKWSAAQSET